MNRKNRIYQVLGLLGIAGSALFCGSTMAVPLPVCGPGAHWVDTCSSGLDTFPSIATIGVDANLDDSEDFNVLLSGPTTVFRGNPIDTPDPLDPGHFNAIDMEIVSFTLTGGELPLLPETVSATWSVIAPSLPRVRSSNRQAMRR